MIKQKHGLEAAHYFLHFIHFPFPFYFTHVPSLCSSSYFPPFFLLQIIKLFP